MNTFYQYSYRINAFFFLIGLLLLALVGQARLATLVDALNSMAATKAQPLVISGGPPALLLVQADALVLPMTDGTAQVTARVRDAQGQPVAGVVVQFHSYLGNVTPATVTTDANGLVTATFQPGGTAGRAVIVASVDELSQEAAIQLVNPATSLATNALTLDFDANQLDPGEIATLSAILRDESGQPVVGEVVTLFGSLGEVIPASAMSDVNGRVIAVYHAGPSNGAAMITALAGVTAQSVTFQVGTPGTPNQPVHKAFLPVISR